MWPHHLLLLLFTFIWGGNFVLAEVALRELAPIAFSVARFLVGAGVLLLLLTFQAPRSTAAPRRQRLFPALDPGDGPRLLVVAVLGAMLAPWLGIEGLGLTYGARAALWLALGPLLSALLGLVLRNERIGRVGYFGILLTVIGAAFLALDGLDPSRGYGLGDLLLVTALAMVVVELHLIKPLVRRYGATPMVAAKMTLGGLGYLAIAAPTMIVQPWTTLGGWTWFAIGFGGAVGVGTGLWIQARALRVMGATRVILYNNLVPLAALGLAIFILGTEPSRLEGLAALLMIGGVICLQVLDPVRRIEQSYPDIPAPLAHPAEPPLSQPYTPQPAVAQAPKKNADP